LDDRRHSPYRLRRSDRTDAPPRPFVRREDCTDDAGSGNNHRIVSARKRLCDRQDYGVAPREIVVGLDVLEGFGRGRH
jgi:hypothetical protein